MKTVHISFNKPLIDDDGEVSNGLEKIIKKYKNKIEFITDESKHSRIKILYNNDSKTDWLNRCINKEILVVNNWIEVEEIIDFYLKYDYETLKEMR